MNQDLLHKYFKGETSVDEEKRILNWVDESEAVSYTHLRAHET